MKTQVSFRALLLAALAAQLLSIPALWGHTSTPAEVFGRYSPRYALVLALHAALTAGYLLALPLAGWLHRTLARLPRWLTRTAAALVTAGMVAVWAFPFEAHALAYFSLNALLLVALLTAGDTPLRPRGILALGVPLIGIVLALAVITTLSMNTFEPDEAHYADIATSFYADGGLYNKSWLSQYYRIEPGLSWFFVAYGGLLEAFGYSVRIGRVLNLAAYGLFFGGVYALSAHLYGRRAALITLGITALSIMFVPSWEYRPNRLVMIVGVWLFYLSLRAESRYILHTLVGLLVTLAMNLHPVAVVLALAFSLYYGIAALWGVFRRQERLWPTVAFGAGALAGTVLYIFTNVLPAGGFDVYLSRLGASTSIPRPPLFIYTRWGSLLEQVLILFGVAYLLWRRTEPDRMLLAMMGLVAFSAYLMDTQGYVWHVGAFYFLPVGALLAGAFDEGRGNWIAGAVVLALAAQMTAIYVDWGTVRHIAQTGALPPYLYDELKPVLPQYVREDDVIYSTHQLIWVFPHTSQPNVVSYAAELNAMRQHNLDSPVEVWEMAQPTVIIFIEDHMHFDPGMQEYMARQPFAVCHTLDVQGKAITIYRPVCPT